MATHSLLFYPHVHHRSQTHPVSKERVHGPYCSIGKVPTNLEPFFKTSTYDIHQFITILKMCKINERKCVKLNKILTAWEIFSEVFRPTVFTNPAYI